MLEDLYNFACDKDKTDGSFYCLQPIVVKKCDEFTKVSNNLQSELDNNEWYEVIDGQNSCDFITAIFCFGLELNIMRQIWNIAFGILSSKIMTKYAEAVDNEQEA